MSDDSGGSKEREREREEIRGNLIQGTNDAADAADAGNSAIVSRNLAAVGCELQCECDPAASPVPTTASSGSGAEGGEEKCDGKRGLSENYSASSRSRWRVDSE